MKVTEIAQLPCSQSLREPSKLKDCLLIAYVLVYRIEEPRKRTDFVYTYKGDIGY